MSEKIELTVDEKLELMEAINSGENPPSHLATKLFPHLQDSFDVKALKNAKIPLLQYEGKQTKAQILAGADSIAGAGPLQVIREFGDVKGDEWRNLIVQGDNLQFLKTCYKNQDPLIKDKVKGKVKLIYIDPPFATKSDFGGNDGERSYQDKVDQSEFLEAMRERLYFMRELLAEDGSIFVHLDQKMSHYVKLVIDEIFGKDRFVNELVWAYKSGGVSKQYFSRKHDNIFFYSKNKSFIFNQPLERTYKYGGIGKSSLQTYHKDENGDEYALVGMRDVITDVGIISTHNKTERTDYPTQKPEDLLNIIILAASNKNDLVMDLFGGSGTTAAVAEKLGRHWITADFGKHSIYTMQKRILRIAESKALGEEAIGNYGKDPKPFAVASVGAYDFTKVMKLSEHKDLYIDFVLLLFHIGRDDKKSQEKFKLANVYALKDNHPVEVYPVWDETYLKQVRIDEEYLQAIVGQSGGKLRGTYYIITPETCTNLADTTIKNAAGQDVTFVMLKFPYKIFEQIARHAQLQEQPSSTANINDLVTSTAFYFNEDVQIVVERVDGGLNVADFESNIFDGDGNKFTGLEGLAMLLIDKDYEAGKPFDMEEAAYAKDIKDGFVAIDGLTDSVAVIAIDKHGNESKPIEIKG